MNRLYSGRVPPGKPFFPALYRPRPARWVSPGQGEAGWGWEYIVHEQMGV